MKRLRFMLALIRWFFKGPGFDYGQHLDDNTRKILWKRHFDRMPKWKP